MAEPASPSSSDLDSMASLPSSSAGSDTLTDTEESERRRRAESDAEREWKESLQQLELLLTMVVVPYLGKYFGRKCAYYGKISDIVAISTVCLHAREVTNRATQVGQDL